MKEIVIKIHDERDIFENDGKIYANLLGLYECTELPKGHDKLIAEPTEEEIAKTIGGNNEFADCIREAVKAVFNNANAVVESDKGEE